MGDIDQDDFLLRLTAQGNMEAYRKLVGRYMHYCVRFAERMLGNRHDAEDVAQEVCLKIWKEAGKWQGQAKFSTWLYRVMFNACIDYKRKVIPLPVGGSVDAENTSLNPEEALEEKQRIQKVIHALRNLPDRQRAALVLSYYEGIKNEQAAEIMGTELGAFQQLIFRARQSLKTELLENVMEETGGQKAR